MSQKSSAEKNNRKPKDKVISKYPEGKKKKKGQKPLPFCRTAPDPEHHRGEDENEPCDDYRNGE
jgi:hypothetical protein